MDISLTIKGEETVTINWGRGLTHLDAASAVVRILADYAPSVNAAGDPFTTELVKIEITPTPVEILPESATRYRSEFKPDD